MSTITQEQQQAITDYLATHVLPAGLGSKESACSIAAINLALTGELTDVIPACMSEVIGKWVIGIQDAMPTSMRNSVEWKRLLPLAAGTGRTHEMARLALIREWMWCKVLPYLQPLADAQGFGAAWQMMTTEKTSKAARAAAQAARAAAQAARATREAQATRAWVAAEAAAWAAEAAAEAAAWATETWAAAAWAAEAWAAEAWAAWAHFDPCAFLNALILVEEQQ